MRSPLSVRDRSSTSKKATRPAEFAVVGVSREQCPARRVDLGDDVGRGFRAQVAEHPLDESGGRQAPRAAGSVAHLEDREFDRILDIHVDPELGMDAAGGVLEDAVAESVAGPVWHRHRSPGTASVTRSGRFPRRAGRSPRRPSHRPDRRSRASGGIHGHSRARCRRRRFPTAPCQSRDSRAR